MTPEPLRYDWIATGVFLTVVVGLTIAGRLLVFRIPEIQRVWEQNRGVDRVKLSRARFRRAVEANQRAGLLTNGVFVAALVPLVVDLAPRPLWRYALEIAAVLMLYDLLYYATHRFLFHGRPLRRIHALHHQARTPTYIDALYVHPLETAIGLALFFGSMPLVAAVAGAPLHAVGMGIAAWVFTQVNQINHTWVHLPRFPFRTLDRITSLHAAHHVDMKRGNYATLTMLYDWLFGTLEKPVSRPAP